MTITNPGNASVQIYSRDEALQEIDRLVAASGMPLAKLQVLGLEHQLNAELRSILADIEGLEWVLDD